MLLGASAGYAAPPPLWETNGWVNAIAQSGDTIYLGGSFGYVGPHTGSGVPITVDTGAADTDFPPVDGGSVFAAVPDGSGGWFIGGFFTTVEGVARRGLAHIRADGALDRDWSPSVNGSVYCACRLRLDRLRGRPLHPYRRQVSSQPRRRR